MGEAQAVPGSTASAILAGVTAGAFERSQGGEGKDSG